MRYLLTVCLTIISALISAAGAEAPVAVGDQAPDFVLPNQAGETVRLSDYRDARNIVLVFMRAHW